MQEIQGNLFDQVDADAICITTNGVVSQRGANVMGKGCAGAAKLRWPGIEYAVGCVIRGFGNGTHLITFEEDGQIFLQEKRDAPQYPRYNIPYHIVVFPTKPGICRLHELLPHYRKKQRLPDSAMYDPTAEEPVFPGWMAQSSPGLIRESAQQLAFLTDKAGWRRVVLPRPGCGAGELSWEQAVKPLLTGILDDRFYVITF